MQKRKEKDYTQNLNLTLLVSFKTSKVLDPHERPTHIKIGHKSFHALLFTLNFVMKF